ncbi:uncharacterized protein LOC133144956 [Syngnathus typhle]|uniref:uncharacterized protein LOC133144956 n=1 Tax=Syngnathus typhle TaxID=161592 RepID=UPI002A6B898A|nr:uncharacterized protein LOC133144956 [Syngnathus typhle]
MEDKAHLSGVKDEGSGSCPKDGDARKTFVVFIGQATEKEVLEALQRATREADFTNWLSSLLVEMVHLLLRATAFKTLDKGLSDHGVLPKVRIFKRAAEEPRLLETGQQAVVGEEFSTALRSSLVKHLHFFIQVVLVAAWHQLPVKQGTFQLEGYRPLCHQDLPPASQRVSSQSAVVRDQSFQWKAEVTNHGPESEKASHGCFYSVSSFTCGGVEAPRAQAKLWQVEDEFSAVEARANIISRQPEKQQRTGHAARNTWCHELFCTGKGNGFFCTKCGLCF